MRKCSLSVRFNIRSTLQRMKLFPSLLSSLPVSITRFLRSYPTLTKEALINRILTQQGIGIRRRAKLLKEHWAPHISACLKLIENWAQTIPANSHSLIIVGAGALHDVDLWSLSKRFTTITLLDADPRCVPVWQKVQTELPNVGYQLGDVTGLLHPWTEYLVQNLQQNSGGWPEALRLLKEFPRLPHASLFAQDPVPLAVLSLNILSQLPIIWREIVEESLEKHFGSKWVATHEQEWLVAYSDSASYLIKEHLQSLGRSLANELLLITDVEYASYHGTKKFGLPSPPPVRWVSSENGRGSWERDPASLHTTPQCEIHNALHGVDLEDHTVRTVLFPQFCSSYQSNWLWHISPLGIEERNTGHIHRLGAFHFRRTLAAEKAVST